MGAPKGKKHRMFTQEQKVRIVEQYFEEHKSGRQFAKEQGINYGCLCRWLKQYHEEGAEGLASHRCKKHNIANGIFLLITYHVQL